MKLALLLALSLPAAAHAGGLFVPGSGAISTSRAGAAVASADDGEALSINPAGLAKTSGTTLTLSAAIISYAMDFTRSGVYDAIPEEDVPYEGQPYPTVKNQPKPKLGIGSYQPVPVVAVISDLGGAVKGLRVAAGLYAPNAYPFRDMNNTNGKEYAFNGDVNAPPPPSRYDILSQDAAVLLPSIAASYRINPKLDVGARFSLAYANVKTKTTLWGVPANVTEWVKRDATIDVDVSDAFVPAFGLGVTFRPTPNIELAAAYNSQVSIHAKGTAVNEKGPQVNLNGQEIAVGPVEDRFARCETGGSFEAQKACVDFALPMTATIGGRYLILASDGKPKGDIELDIGWENWSAERVTDYRVVVDSAIYINNVAQLSLKDNFVRHQFNDVFTLHLGGSYTIPQGANEIVVRGGVGYDTQAAKTGWLRADVDGAARTTIALGATYKMKKLAISAGGGYIIEGSPQNSGTCNPTDPALNMLGCNGDGVQRPIDQRNGPDPINPLAEVEDQIESPVAQGKYTSSYTLIMLGVTTWF